MAPHRTDSFTSESPDTAREQGSTQQTLLESLDHAAPEAGALPLEFSIKKSYIPQSLFFELLA